MNYFEAYNLIDLFILGTMALTIILGLWRGFIRTLSAVAGLTIGVIGALKYHYVVQPYLNKVSSLDPKICAILSMIIIFIAVQAIFVLIRRILDALLDLTRLSWLDRILGAGMGACAGFLCTAATVQILIVAVPEWSAVGTSRLIRPVERLTGQALAYAPEQVNNQLQSFMTKLKGTQDGYPQASRQQKGAADKALPGPQGSAK
jgi:membrane protein required for colicin V production